MQNVSLSFPKLLICNKTETHSKKKKKSTDTRPGTQMNTDVSA